MTINLCVFHETKTIIESKQTFAHSMTVREEAIKIILLPYLIDNECYCQSVAAFFSACSSLLSVIRRIRAIK